MANEPWYVTEILGEPIIERPLRKVPDLPWLDDAPEIRELQKSSGAADSTIAEIELQELTDQFAPIPSDVLAERDAERFAPRPKPAPGLNFVKNVLDAQRFTEEVLSTATALGNWTPKAHAMLGNLIEASKPSRRRQINDRLERHGLYKHELMDRWNQMLVAFDNDATAALPDNALLSKATSFLAEA
jgi:hypothetical protein